METIGTEAPRQPRVSVVIAAYNAAHTVSQTIDSLLSQTRRPDEIVVVDDGSTDDTQRILNRYRGQLRAITQTNRGLAAARNTGFEAATGDYIAVIDSDDLAHERRIELQSACLRADPSITLCFSEFSAFGDVEAPSYMKRYYSEAPRDPSQYQAHFGAPFQLTATDGTSVAAYRSNLFDKLVHGNFVHPPTMMLRRTLFQATGPFDGTFRFNSDWDWIARASRHGQFAFIDAPLIAYRISNAQMSGRKNKSAMYREILEISERLSRLDPELFKRHERQFRAEFFDRCLAVADVSSTTDRMQCLRMLAKCLTYGGPQIAMLGPIAKVMLPSSALDLIRGLRGSARRTAS